jgi:predicted GIY-YIG superfamily endonuclease
LITVYVLKGETSKRYVDITKDLPRRLREYRSQKSKGSQIIGHFFVLHTETFPDYIAARMREKFLKSGQGRNWLDDLESKSEPARGGYSP